MTKKNLRSLFLGSLACLVLVPLAACTSSTYSGDDVVVGGTSYQARPLTTIPSHLGDSNRNGAWMPGARRSTPQQSVPWLSPP